MCVVIIFKCVLVSDARGRGEDQKQEVYPNDEAQTLQGTDAVIVELLLFHYYLLPFCLRVRVCKADSIKLYLINLFYGQNEQNLYSKTFNLFQRSTQIYF